MESGCDQLQMIHLTKHEARWLSGKKKKGGVIFPEGRGMDAAQSIDILHGECCANEGRTEVWKAFICLFTPAPVIILRDPCFHLNNSSKTSKFLGLCNSHNFHKNCLHSISTSLPALGHYLKMLMSHPLAPYTSRLLCAP